MHQVSPVPLDGEAYNGWVEEAWKALEAAGEKLEALGEGEALVVVVPTRRLDISVEIDLVEEIARSEGYDQIPVELPNLESRRGGRTPLATKVLEARRALAGAGLTEVLTHSLIAPKVYDKLQLPADSRLRTCLTILNPLYEDRSTLRTTMLPSLLDTIQYNVNRQTRDLSLFDMGTVYWPVAGETLPEEHPVLAIALTGSQASPAWNKAEQPADFYTLKGVVEALLGALGVVSWSVTRSAHPSFHPGRQAALAVAGRQVGVFGEIHPAVQAAWDLPNRVYMAELNFADLAAGARERAEYRPVPRFPAVSRDVAMIVANDLPGARIPETIAAAGGDLVEGVQLFDLYQGEHVKAGYRSLAYRIVYRAADRTLTDVDVEAVHGKVRAALQALGAELRS
jgi:phenylalanyl-tRNA synthetase beta chain